MAENKATAQPCGGVVYTLEKDGVICGKSSLPDCGYSSDMLEELRAAGYELFVDGKKEWSQQEIVAVSMTREEWQSIISWLTYGADWNHARMTWWRECCDDKRTGAETAAKYEAAMLKAERLRKIIEEATNGENKTQ